MTMKNKKIILIAIAIALFSILLTSCSFIDNIMNPIVDNIIENENDGTNFIYATVTLENDTYTYSGDAFSPNVTKVEIMSIEIPAEHYTVSYADNVNSGIASVSVTAVGDVYSGSKSKTFTIVPKPLTEVTALLVSEHTYTGAAITPALSNIKCGTVALTETDYDISYSNNINVSQENAVITLTGKGNYTGSVLFNFSINSLNLDTASITLNRSTYEYTGTACEPEVTKITIGDKDYYISSDNYDITYSGNIEVTDVATLTITGKNNCIGQASIYFKITDESLNTILLNSVGEHNFDSISELAGEKISKPDDPIVPGKENSSINWYTLSSYSLDSRFFFDVMPDTDIELFGRWEEEISPSFFAYPNATPDLDIDSFEELVALIDYVCFNHITTSEEQSEYYKMNYTYTNFEQEITDAWGQQTYPTTTTSYGTIVNGDPTSGFKIYLASSGGGSFVFEPTIAAAATSTTQYNSLNNINISPTRSNEYNDFYIEQLIDSYEVTTSNQLFYVLEHGLKPLPQAGSTASTIYDEAKIILRQIINDDMSDYDKANAIYQWIANNVTYDYGVNNLELDWINYNDFYLEGVFIDRIAVCDGISKAYVVMCQMEGIPCVRVVGYIGNDPNLNGHAWNKIKIDGQWFVVDPTWGNTSTNSNANEFLNYQHFMTSDTTKQVYDCNATSNTHQGIAATGENNYYENYGFPYNETDYDFVIESQQELNILIQYCINLDDITNCTINFIVTFDYGDDIQEELTLAIPLGFIGNPYKSYFNPANAPEIITIVFS